MEDHFRNENPVPHVLLHEQEIATQKIIQAQSQREAAAGPPCKDGTDLFLERPDPNALKEHLLKMASEHRAELASKRGKPNPPEQGNIDIGNGYGVPGGGAYSYGTPGSNIATPGNLGHNLETDAPQLMETAKLPPGWVEAKDPSSGASYYYNESKGKSQWERPVETSSSTHFPFATRHVEDWVEAVDETTGRKYYYNTKTNISQWECPDVLKPFASQHPGSMVSESTVNENSTVWSSNLDKCFGCGGWGVSLVQAWGYCNHCTRPRVCQRLWITSSIIAMRIRLLSQDPEGDRLQEKETEKTSGKGSIPTTMMMSWTQWIQAHTPMLLVVGPLFQQRPYPSPGAVLRKNAEIASQTKKSSSHWTPVSKKGDGSDGLGDAD
ncbi:WW domain-binding 4 [Gossypium arboreum]|uniref:Polyglutamine-binding protein 1 n=1 Tax=Gossypium arboreum TaxID=29729 RepID=A0A0B0PJV8_GOSAR|nr:WW domain-binding 4 [Gossypium arboreum]